MRALASHGSGAGNESAARVLRCSCALDSGVGVNRALTYHCRGSSMDFMIRSSIKSVGEKWAVCTYVVNFQVVRSFVRWPHLLIDNLLAGLAIATMQAGRSGHLRTLVVPAEHRFESITDRLPIGIRNRLKTVDAI